MLSADGRFVLVFNGEIYNHRDLRRELEQGGSAPAWRGHSDTEVLLAAIVRWGLEAALKRSNGMFALALWDRQEKTLQLARDRLGEKPMYYGMAGRTLLFGSELKALRVHPAWHRRDRSRCTQPADAPHVYSGAVFDLSGHCQAAAGYLDHLQRGTGSARAAAAGGLLVGAACAGEMLARPAATVRCGSHRCAGRTAARCGRPAHGSRRAAGCVSVGRHRFIDGGRADAGPVTPTGADLLDRLSRRRLRRSAVCACGGGTSRYRAHRAVCGGRSRRGR